MTRRLASLAIAGSMLLALGACSKNDTATTTATQAPATTEKKSSDTTKADQGDTDTTKKSTGTTAKKSTGTTSKTGTTSRSGTPSAKNLETTPEEEQCFEEKFAEAVTQNPELAQQVGSSDAAAAQAVGNLLAACVSKAKIADALLAGLKSNNNFSDTEASCIRDEIISLDTEQLGNLVGLVIFASASENLAPVAPVVSALNQKCGTKIPA